MRAKSSTVLVTGGAGFIGSHLCDRLVREGARVLCVDSLLTGSLENIRHLQGSGGFGFIQHDIIAPLPETLFERRDPIAFIYNFACPASPPQYQADPEHTLLTNVLGTRNLLSLAEQVGARMLLSSTSEVYGDPEVHPQHEDYRGAVSCTGPRACYDEGKRAAETLAFDYFRGRRCDIRVARIFNTYGPRMRADDGRVVSNVISQALAGKDITIYGDGLQTRSFCYVDDLIEGVVRLMHSEQAAGIPVNLGNPNELTVRELVELVVELTGSRSRVVRRPLPEDDPLRRNPDITRARELLGWQPAVSLRSGLQRTIAWLSGEGRGRASPPAVGDLAAAE